MGGTEKGKDQRKRVSASRLLRVATKPVLPTCGCIVVSPLCFFSLAAPQAALQPMDPFLNVRFLFVLFKMWHSGSFLKGRRRQRSVGLPSARARADQAEQGRRGAQPGSRRCHLLNGLSGTVCQWLSVPSGACM